MKLALILSLAAPCFAQFGFFDQMFNQGGGRQEKRVGNNEKKVNNIVENTYNDQQCDKYLCEDTLQCVDGPNDCPCMFPDSQMKCVLPNKQGYVCISKPTNDDGPDCDYIKKLYQ